MKFWLLLILPFTVFTQLNTTSDSLRGFLYPERSCYDVHYYDLKFDIDFQSKSISGENSIYFEVVESTQKLQVDLFKEMRVEEVSWNNQKLEIERLENALYVHFPEELKKGSKEVLKISFEGKPIEAQNPPWDGGFVWRKDDKGRDWLGTAVQGLGASAFWPNKDHLSDEPDSMKISAMIPKDMEFVCNGNKIAERPLIKEKKEVSWFVSYPINTYNISLNVAHYLHYSDQYINKGDTLAMDYYVLDYNLEKAKKHFEFSKSMIRAFEGKLGQYPFHNDGFGVVETHYLGMEHQSAIAYGNHYKNGYRGAAYMGFDFDYLLVHEYGHEYWGNHVSMNDLGDMWIHESFCTYSEAIYVEYLHGYDQMLKYLENKKDCIRNDKPVQGPYHVNSEGSSDMYCKGALMLNSMRHTIDNDSLWWSILGGLQKEYGMKTVGRKEVIAYMNEKAQKDLTPIFVQFLDTTAIPVLEHKIEGDSLKYRWEAVSDFNMPVELMIDQEIIRIQPTEEWQFLLIDNQEYRFDQLRFFYELKSLE